MGAGQEDRRKERIATGEETQTVKAPILKRRPGRRHSGANWSVEARPVDGLDRAGGELQRLP